MLFVRKQRRSGVRGGWWVPLSFRLVGALTCSALAVTQLAVAGEKEPNFNEERTHAYQEAANVLWSSDATAEAQAAAAEKFLQAYPEGDYADAIRVRCWQLGLSFEGLGVPPSPSAEQIDEATKLMQAILDSADLDTEQKVSGAACYFGTFGKSDSANEIKAACESQGIKIDPVLSTPDRALSCLRVIMGQNDLEAPASSPRKPLHFKPFAPREWENTVLVGLDFGVGAPEGAPVTGSYVGAPPPDVVGPPFSGTLNPAASIYSLRVTWYQKKAWKSMTNVGFVAGLDGSGNVYNNETQDVKDHYLGVSGGVFKASRRFFLSSLQLGGGAHFRNITIPTVSGFYNPHVTGGVSLSCDPLDIACWVFDSVIEAYQVQKVNSQMMVGDPAKALVPYVSARLDLNYHPMPRARVFIGLFFMVRYDLMPAQGSVVVSFHDYEYDVSWEEQWDITSQKLFASGGLSLGFEI